MENDGQEGATANEDSEKVIAEYTRPEEPVDPTAEFDPTREDRINCLRQVETVLKLGYSGKKIDRKDIMKALTNLTRFVSLQEQQMQTMLSDMLNIVQAVAKNETSVFALRTNTKALLIGLVKKGFVTAEEIMNIHNREVLPAELPPEMREELEKVMKEKDEAAAATASHTEAQ